MASIHPSTEDGSSSLSDPWYWEVEDVIAALCDPNSPLRKAHRTPSFPDAAKLAEKLREHDVNGIALLKKVDDKCMKEDFGIKSMGHRASLEELIEALQYDSPKYQDREARRTPSIATRSNQGWGSRMVTPIGGTFHQSGPSPAAPLPWHSPRPYDSRLPSPKREVEGLTKDQKDPRPRNLLAEAPPLPQSDWPTPQILTVAEATRTLEDNASDTTYGANGNAPRTIQHVTEMGRTDGTMTTQQDDPQEHEKPGMSGPTTVIDDSGRKRKGIAPTFVSPLKVPPGSLKLPQAEFSTSQAQAFCDTSPVTHTEHIYLDTHIERSPSGPEEAQNSAQQDTPAENFDQSIDGPRLPEPGTTQIDKNGRKRIVPIPQPAPEHAWENLSKALGKNAESQLTSSILTETSNTRTTSLGRKAQRRPDQTYLGLDNLGVDELFYGDTELGSFLEDSEHGDSDDFHFAYPSDASKGRKIYVHARIKHYLQVRPIRLVSRAHSLVGVIPYPDRIGRKRQPLSMTVFSKETTEKATARRLERSKYIKDDDARIESAVGISEASGGFNVADPAMAVDDIDDQDWKGLGKWKYMDGNEKILPVYGESGSEGDYDLQTWKEMAKEARQLKKAEERPRKRSLSNEEIEDAISKAMEAIVQEWHDKRRPKLQLRAWRIWTRAKRDRTRQHQTQQLDEVIQRYEDRIKKCRDEITGQIWSKSIEVTRQCKSLEPSIYDLEALKWEREILRLPEAPQKIASKLKKSKTAPIDPAKAASLAHSRKGLGSDVETSGISEDSLDDFVVSDNEGRADTANQMVLDDEFTTADAEDEADDVTSDTLDQPPVTTAISRLDKSSAPERNLPTTSHLPNGSQSEGVTLDYIDLTQLSSEVEPFFVTPKREGMPGVKTPPVDNGNESEVWLPPKSVFKRPPSLPARQDNIIDLDTSSDVDFSSLTQNVNSEKPPFSHVDGIAMMNPEKLVEQQDRKRLLIWTIKRTDPDQRSLSKKVLEKESMEFVQKHVLLGLAAFKSNRLRMRQLEPWVSDGLMQIAAWYVSWTIPVKLSQSGFKPAHLETTIKEMQGFEIFYDFLISCMQPYWEDTKRLVKDRSISPVLHPSIAPQKSTKQRIIRDNLTVEGHTQHRKRVFAVQESQETLAKRQSAQDRLQKDEERRLQRRREELSLKRTRPDSVGTETKIVLNPGKADDQKYIYLDPRFGNGQSLKPHQVEGLQFLWREVTADHDDLQGCLLAHTMGLGKTIQVIALMVALAGASQSIDAIRQQVPPSLQKSQTLILCPPALVENWWDELFMWVPEPGTDTVGQVRTVNTAKKLEQRISEISIWNDGGGVLLMAYSTFVDLIENKKNKNDVAPLKEADHHMVKMALLDRTNLVVADEAHEFKKQTTKLSRCMNQIRTKSRIALTGSPLSNNLKEYFALVDWISPGFLGSLTEFRATYEEPIHEGLYQDSSNGEFREALKRLKALQLEMEPKVHRADFAVLHKALHGKMEFVIQLPLGDIQDRLYRIFVEETQRSIVDEEPHRAVIWMWLKLLQLLCHHPKVYCDKLQLLKTEIQAQSKGKAAVATAKETDFSEKPSPERTSASDDDEQALVAHPELQSAFKRVITKSQDYLSGLGQDLADPSISYKMVISLQIVQLSIKAGDKVLIFSHRRPALDYIAEKLASINQVFARIDGRVLPQKRQAITKSFNDGSVNVCLISTMAGGVGLNLYGANRVIILDEWFNPMFEQQAIGRSYRIGQMKPVYVYRLTIAGTFEQALQNQGLFKEQLATRVVDKKNPVRSAIKGAGQYFFEPKMVKQESLENRKGDDVSVLDVMLADRDK